MKAKECLSGITVKRPKCCTRCCCNDELHREVGLGNRSRDPQRSFGSGSGARSPDSPYPCLLAGLALRPPSPVAPRPLSLSFSRSLQVPARRVSNPADVTRTGSRHKRAPPSLLLSRLSRNSCSTPRQSRLSVLAPDHTFRWTCSCFGIYSLPLHMFSLLFFRPRLVAPFVGFPLVLFAIRHRNVSARSNLAP